MTGGSPGWAITSGGSPHHAPLQQAAAKERNAVHPVLIDVGGYLVFTYTACLALALTVSFFWLRVPGARIYPEIRACFWTVFSATAASAFFGGRLLAIALGTGPGNIREIFSAADEGLSTFGAILGICAGAFLASRSLRLDGWRLLDAIAPSIAFSHALARVGCFMAGCCYGRPAAGTAFWTVAFTDPRSAVPSNLLGVSLYPTQLFEAFGDCLIGIVLWAVLARSGGGRFRGHVFACYAIGYCLLRLAVDRFRPPSGGEALPLVFLATAFSALAVDIIRKRRDPDFSPSTP